MGLSEKSRERSEMPAEEISNTNNIRIYWSAGLSPFISSLVGKSWAEDTGRIHGESLKRILLFSGGGKSSCFLDWDERAKFAGVLIEKYGKNQETIQLVCDRVGADGPALVSRGRELAQKPNKESYEELKKAVLQYNAWYVVPRHLADFMPPDELAPYLEILGEARKKVETLHAELDEIFGGIISRLVGGTEDEVLSWTITEADEAIDGKIPPIKNFHSMADFGLLVTKSGEEKFSADESHKLYEKLTEAAPDTTEIHGTVAFRGHARGIARIVLDPAKAATFNDGDILVAEMTRPDYLALMKKSAAVVTDIGGLLSHAAIVSREMKKPCVIGTKNATKILKDGDLIEVDAERGVVKILQRDEK